MHNPLFATLPLSPSLAGREGDRQADMCTQPNMRERERERERERKRERERERKREREREA
jgi:hypothetical protein